MTSFSSFFLLFFLELSNPQIYKDENKYYNEELKFRCAEHLTINPDRRVDYYTSSGNKWYTFTDIYNSALQDEVLDFEVFYQGSSELVTYFKSYDDVVSFTVGKSLFYNIIPT